MLEAIWESRPFSFELNPAMLKLAMTLIINSLPVIIDDKVSNINSVLRKSLLRRELSLR